MPNLFQYFVPLAVNMPQKLKTVQPQFCSAFEQLCPDFFKEISLLYMLLSFSSEPKPSKLFPMFHNFRLRDVSAFCPTFRADYYWYVSKIIGRWIAARMIVEMQDS